MVSWGWGLSVRALRSLTGSPTVWRVRCLTFPGDSSDANDKDTPFNNHFTSLFWEMSASTSHSQRQMSTDFARFDQNNSSEASIELVSSLVCAGLLLCSRDSDHWAGQGRGKSGDCSQLQCADPGLVRAGPAWTDRSLWGAGRGEHGNTRPVRRSIGTTSGWWYNIMYTSYTVLEAVSNWRSLIYLPLVCKRCSKCAGLGLRGHVLTSPGPAPRSAARASRGQSCIML